MDSARVNTPLEKDVELQQLKITANCMSAHSRSKNNLAILDTRVAKLTKFLVLALNEHKDPHVIAEKVSVEHNKLRGSHGFSPAELLSGKDQFSGEDLQINWSMLVKMRRAARELSRRANEKMMKQGKFRIPMKLVPFEEGCSYGDAAISPIKLNDIVLISGIFEKNNSRPFYKVIASTEIPEGVDFENQLVHTVKMDLKKHGKGSERTWSFNCIRCVIDGDKDEDLPEPPKEDYDSLFFKSS